MVSETTRCVPPRPATGAWRRLGARFVALVALLVVGAAVGGAQETVIQRSVTGEAAQASDIPKSPQGVTQAASPRTVDPGLRPSLAGQPDDAPAPPPATRLVAIELAGDGRRTQVTLVLSTPVPLDAVPMPGPDRVVISAGAITAEAVQAGAEPPRSLVTGYRYGALGGGRVGVILDTRGPVTVSSVTDRPVEAGTAVVFTLEPSTPEGVARQQADGVRWGDPARPVASPGPAPERSPGARPVIVIDPGHGGADPGAVTEAGVYEKDVVLAVARQLKAALDAGGRVETKLTRDGDAFVSLDRRIAISRATRADLFVSLHADTFAGLPQAAAVRGGSVYVLSDRASNRAAALLAEKENAADRHATGEDAVATGDQDVDGILADLMVRETATFSTRAQSLMITNLKRSIAMAREPARAAGFRVLRQPSTPAVLIELGYMSNADDVALLQSPAWQTQVALQIARAVEAYVAAPRRVVGTP